MEVRLEGHRIGELTPAMSAEYILIFRQLEPLRRATAAKVLTVEFLLFGGLVLTAVTAWQRWGPSPPKGVATRDHAEQVFGLTRPTRGDQR